MINYPPIILAPAKPPQIVSDCPVCKAPLKSSRSFVGVVEVNGMPTSVPIEIRTSFGMFECKKLDEDHYYSISSCSERKGPTFFEILTIGRFYVQCGGYCSLIRRNDCGLKCNCITVQIPYVIPFNRLKSFESVKELFDTVRLLQ